MVSFVMFAEEFGERIVIFAFSMRCFSPEIKSFVSFSFLILGTSQIMSLRKGGWGCQAAFSLICCHLSELSAKDRDHCSMALEHERWVDVG